MPRSSPLVPTLSAGKVTFRAVMTEMSSGVSGSSDVNVVLEEPVPLSMRTVASIIGGVGTTVFCLGWKIYGRFCEKKKPQRKEED